MVPGGDEMHRPTNTWWGRNMVCLSADQFAVDVKRSKLEGRSGIFDVEMDSGIPGPSLESRRDEGMPTATALHLRQKSTYPRCEFTATAEEAMWRPRRRW